MCLDDFDGLVLFSGLHCASYFGIVQIVATLAGMEGCDIDKVDGGGNTPLVRAARCGHERVVKFLLGQEAVNPNGSDKYDWTPLCIAARSGHEEVVKILPGRGGVDLDKSDVLGRTPLHWTAEKGFEGVVKILLGQDSVNPEKSDISDQTPLCLAAGSGHEGVVKILLERDDVNADKSDEYGQTPLYLAARDGYEGVVIMLLGRNDVNPDKPNVLGQTPLSLAAKRGFQGVVRVLLEAASPATLEISGRTSLPAELGPLPLYRDDDGFYSVLGPPLSETADEDQPNGSTNGVFGYNPPMDKRFYGASECPGIRSAPLPLFVYLSPRLTQSSGPHTCTLRSYTCSAPNCTFKTPFRTKKALNRHYEAKHLARRFGCPAPGCERVSKRGFGRYDNFVAHMRCAHGASPAGRLC